VNALTTLLAGSGLVVEAAAAATVLTSLFGALLAFRFGALTAWDQDSALEIVATSFRAGLLGLLVCLGFVALGLVASGGLGAPGLDRPRSGAPNIEPPRAKS